MANGRRVPVPGLNRELAKRGTAQGGTGQAPEPEAPHDLPANTNQQGGDRAAARRAFAEWEGGRLAPGEFLGQLEQAGWTLTPKVRQMAYVVGSSTFQGFLKELCAGSDSMHKQLPQNQVSCTQVDPRKPGENARFVVPPRNTLYLTPRHPMPRDHDPS